MLDNIRGQKTEDRGQRVEMRMDEDDINLIEG